MFSKSQPRWLFWLEVFALVIGIIVAANELIAVISDPTSPIGRLARYYSLLSERAICDPAILTLEEFDLCLRQGGVEK